MLTIGLTGGIASGKTTVASYFAKLGTTIIDADIIAREVVEPDTNAYKEIVQHFGKIITNDNRKLNREKLRKIIFNNEQERLWLENLLHPLIRTEIQKQIKTTTSNYCILVIPLLLEKGKAIKVDRILIVDMSESLQEERLIKRDQLSKEQAHSILKAQLTRSERLRHADDIIINDGDFDKLELQIKTLHKKYMRLSQ